MGLAAKSATDFEEVTLSSNVSRNWSKHCEGEVTLSGAQLCSTVGVHRRQAGVRFNVTLVGLLGLIGALNNDIGFGKACPTSPSAICVRA